MFLNDSDTTMMFIATRMEGMESERNEKQAGERRLSHSLARSLTRNMLADASIVKDCY